MTFGITSEPGYSTQGRLLVIDPGAHLGVVSDIDDTIIHTGLTRVVEAIRTSLFVHEHDRLEIPGASELYRALVAGCGRLSPVLLCVHRSVEPAFGDRAVPG
ncbi:MAG: phosphatase domain-containing protein [Nocardioidaceae bacterium]